LKKVHDPVVAVKDLQASHLTQCEELGAAIAAGLAMGVF
jgi:hypothetical protein